MSRLLPPPLVDAMPEELWSAGNLQQLFGQSLHFCVGDGVRTIELNGREVAQGRRPFTDFVLTPSTGTGLRRWRVDLGWLVVGAVSVYLGGAAILSRIIRGPSSDIQRH
jgi:hypothetical protein